MNGTSSELRLQSSRISLCLSISRWGFVLAVWLGSGMVWPGADRPLAPSQVPGARCQNGLDPISLRVEKLQMLRSSGVPADRNGLQGLQRSTLIEDGQDGPSPNGRAVLCDRYEPHTPGWSCRRGVGPSHSGSLIGQWGLT